ncbi:MAG: hypothetical protein WBV85_01895 [Solirubrobacteraceae bacterium]
MRRAFTLRPTARRAFTLSALLAFTLCLAPALAASASVGAQESSTATIAPSLLPDRLGAMGSLRLTVNFGEALSSGIPLPVRRAVLRFPAGLGIEIPHLRSCSIARLRARGPSGCSTQSELGTGHALAEAMAGSQLIAENISLWLFLGPFHNLEPTFEILGQGVTPFDERVVLRGTVVPDHPPYGEDLVLSVPPIPTVPLEPDASMASMSLTVGTNKSPHPNQANTVVVPPSCPTGGFPFAAEITYADGSSGNAFAHATCPGR